MKNSPRCSTVKFGDGREKACRDVSATVISPPDLACSKSAVVPDVSCPLSKYNVLQRAATTIAGVASALIREFMEGIWIASIAQAFQIGQEYFDRARTTRERQRFGAQRIDCRLHALTTLGVLRENFAVEWILHRPQGFTSARNASFDFLGSACVLGLD
jgi:hypothetical protein